jgi:hypothetical protein
MLTISQLGVFGRPLMSTYSWQSLYEAAVLETERSKLPALIQKAEHAVESRLSQLDPTDGLPERRLLESARQGLAALRCETEGVYGQEAAN